jgi:hypothetical protein
MAGGGGLARKAAWLARRGGERARATRAPRPGGGRARRAREPAPEARRRPGEGSTGRPPPVGVREGPGRAAAGQTWSKAWSERGRCPVAGAARRPPGANSSSAVRETKRRVGEAGGQWVCGRAGGPGAERHDGGHSQAAARAGRFGTPSGGQWQARRRRRRLRLRGSGGRAACAGSKSVSSPSRGPIAVALPTASLHHQLHPNHAPPSPRFTRATKASPP